MEVWEGIDDRIIIDQKYLDMSQEELEKLHEEIMRRPKKKKMGNWLEKA